MTLLSDSDEHPLSKAGEAPASLLIVLDPEGRVVTLNSASEALTGYSSSEAEGRAIWDFLTAPEDRQALKEGFHEILKAPRALDQQCHLLARDGTRRLVAWSHSVLRNDAGAPEYVICTGADITAQLDAEDQARDRGARLIAILDGAADAIITANEDGVIETVNPATERLFGYGSDELVGQKVSLLMPEPDRSAHDGYMRRYRRTGEKRIIGFGREVLAQRKGGAVFPVHLSISEVSFDHRRLFTAIVHDITRRKSTEEELRHAQKLEVIGQLTGGIAHDFNNLLTVVLGNLEMLEGRVTDQRQRAMVKQAQSAAELGAELTDRLLTFARRRPLEARVRDLNELILGMADMLRRTLGETVDVSIVLSPKLWPTRVDTGQLESALLNLALNARDAMADGGALTIETTNVELDQDSVADDPEALPGAYVRMSISDTGVGMPPDVKSRAFEPFFTTKGAGAGTGLGLSMVYGFARQAGGFAKIYSEPDYGSTISIFLPKAADAAVAEGEPARMHEPAPGRGEVVLVVEDDPRVREVTVSRLKALGYEVLEAADGRSALEVLELKKPVNLLFTDIVMSGGISGRDLAQEVRERHPGVKVLYTSGYAAGAALQRGELLAGDTLLAKPYRTADLACRVRAVLDG